MCYNTNSISRKRDGILISVFLIALSLAADAFAVSVSTGVSINGFTWRQALKLGCWFGAFQFIMPLIGWFLGSSVSTYIEAFDNMIAFVLLALIGGRMIWEAWRGGEDNEAVTELTIRRLAMLAIATSIDALAVGVPMAFMEVNIFLSATVIGAVAFTLSIIGGMLGRRLGSLFQRQAAVLGGLVLIGIGIKMLLENS